MRSRFQKRLVKLKLCTTGGLFCERRALTRATVFVTAISVCLQQTAEKIDPPTQRLERWVKNRASHDASRSQTKLTAVMQLSAWYGAMGDVKTLESSTISAVSCEQGKQQPPQIFRSSITAKVTQDCQTTEQSELRLVTSEPTTSNQTKINDHKNKY